MKIHYEINDAGWWGGRKVRAVLRLELRFSKHYHYRLNIEAGGEIAHQLMSSSQHRYSWNANEMTRERLELMMLREKVRIAPGGLRLLEWFNRYLIKKTGRTIYRTLRFLPGCRKVEFTVLKSNQASEERNIRLKLTPQAEDNRC